jgi:phage-related protein
MQAKGTQVDQGKKPVIWMGNSRKDLKAMPQEVRIAFAYGLLLAQQGQHHPDAKPLKGMQDVYELIEDEKSDTYRAVYTI